MHKHAVAGSGALTPHLFCNQPVHRYGLSFTVRFSFTICYHDSSTCLFSVTRSPVSPVTLIRHCHRCKKIVHRAGSYLFVQFTESIFLAAPCPSGCSLSPETEKVDSLKSFLKQSPRPVRGAAKLSTCCELSTETNFQKSQPSHTSIFYHDLSTVTCPAAPGLQRPVFMTAAVSKRVSVPDTETKLRNVPDIGNGPPQLT